MSFRAAPVTGSDGHAPMYDPESGWRIWAMHELYLGVDGRLKYVPKVKDHVKDVDTLAEYKVVYVDPVSLIPTLEPIRVGESDLLTGPSADSYRVYLDTSVVPHILAVDARLRVAGSMCEYAKIYRGSDISSTGQVVSFLFDTNGDYLTDRIPLELASIDSHTNASIKVVTRCHTKEKMKDGERVTVVIYDSQGHVVAIRSLIVVNTSFIRNIGAGLKYISHIALESPFISTSNPNVLEYPINVPVQAFNMHGLVYYSDGSVVKHPVDGVRFKMLGLEPFVSTVVGQKIKLVLSYKLAQDEATYAAHSSQGKFVTEGYDLITTQQDGAYTVKLFCYPVWVDSSIGYRLNWFMMDLNRDVLLDVTPFIYFNSNSDVFDGKNYTKNQMLSVRINLKDASRGLKSYIHTQVVYVALKAGGDSKGTRWLVASEINQNPYYGLGVVAKAKSLIPQLFSVNLASGCSNLSEWLEKVYLPTKPLMDRKKESQEPQPTHIVVHYGSSTQEWPIADFNKDLQVTGSLDLHKNLYVEFTRKVGTDTLRLSIAGFSMEDI